MYLAPPGAPARPRVEAEVLGGDRFMRMVALDTADRTYLSWHWLDRGAHTDAAHHGFYFDVAAWRAVAARLTSALARGTAGRSMWAHSALTDREAERSLAQDLGGSVVPREWWEQVERAANRQGGGTATVGITPSPRLAAVPWEILISPVSGRRLVELARVIYEVPASAHWARGRLPRGEHNASDRPLRTVDVSAGHVRASSVLQRRVLTPDGVDRLLNAWGVDLAVPPRMSRADLRNALRADPSPTRWLYVGHVSPGGDVGLAAIHLTDDGTGQPDPRLPWFGYGTLDGRHRSLTARDLFFGTLDGLARGADQWGGAHLPDVPGSAGHEIWPMPPRVALIACSSGSDHGSSEIFGLASAALNAGAEWVTATRWVIPTDAAFAQSGPLTRGSLPFTDMVMAIDAAHRADVPLEAVRDWQLERLEAWARDGALADSPLLWGAVVTFWMPARPDLRNPEFP